MTERSGCVYRYGNTSSGSLWYALSYIESCQRVKKGETVWQVSQSITLRLARIHQPLTFHVSSAHVSPACTARAPHCPALSGTVKSCGRVHWSALWGSWASCMHHGSWACSMQYVCSGTTSIKQSSACKRLVSVRAELPRSALLRSSSAAKRRVRTVARNIRNIQACRAPLAVTSVSWAELGWNAQVGFGSGFKCNSVVWKAIRNIHDTEHAEWAHMSNPANTEPLLELHPGALLIASASGKTSESPGCRQWHIWQGCDVAGDAYLWSLRLTATAHAARL